MGYNDDYNRARSNSVGNQRRIPKQKTYRVTEKGLKRLSITSYIAGILTVGVVWAAIAGGGALINKVGYQIDVKNASLEESFDANGMLADADLFVVPDYETKEWNNDYTKLEGLSEDDLYGFSCYLGYNEAEKVVQALGYKSWDNYFAMKGYVDKEGKPSREVWTNYAEAAAVREYNAEKEASHGK